MYCAKNCITRGTNISCKCLDLFRKKSNQNMLESIRKIKKEDYTILKHENILELYDEMRRNRIIGDDNY